MSDNNMTTKEIAKQIRSDLKAMKGFKFSVRTEYFSMGSAIHLNVMKSPVRMLKGMSEITNIDPSINYTIEQIAKMQSEKCHQLNDYQLRDKYDPALWCNGVFLTEEGHNILQKIVNIAKKEHHDDSDPMTDYFNVNFYFHIGLGQWDKEFVDGN